MIETPSVALGATGRGGRKGDDGNGDDGHDEVTGGEQSRTFTHLKIEASGSLSTVGGKSSPYAATHETCQYSIDISIALPEPDPWRNVCSRSMRQAGLGAPR